MFLAANPNKDRTAEEKEESRAKYTPGDDVLPKVDKVQKTLQERRVDDDDRRLMDEVRAMSLQEVGVETSGARRERRRRDDSRLRTGEARPSRSREESRDSRDTRHREHREHREQRRRRAEGDSGSDTRRRRDEASTLRPEAESASARRQRRSQEDSRLRREETNRSAARQIEHQSSLRSLISSSEIDSHEMEEEILRQIHEENLLEGIDLENFDVTTEDQISERIVEAFRKRQREQARAQQSRRRTDSSPTEGRIRGQHSRDVGRDDARTSSRHRGHSRSTSAVSQADEIISRPPLATSSRLEVQSSDEGRRRRRTTSEGRSATMPVPGISEAATRPAARSQNDLSSRPRSFEPQPSRRTDSGERRGNTPPVSQLPNRAELPGLPGDQPAPNTHVDQQESLQTNEGVPDRAELPSNDTGGIPPATGAASSPTQTPLSPRQTLAPSDALVPAPLTLHSHSRTPSLSDRAAAVQGASRPTSSSSATSRPRSPRYHEPSITCSRCAKTHIEYELHYNCAICSNGDWNICLSCYRTGRGCLHWFGFGKAAWARWEMHVNSGDKSTNADPPHMLYAERYLPPKVTEGGADGRRTITSEDPQKRLQSGTFCANCLAWANECYWRCDVCNEGDWGFCNVCVNQGKCCTHPLLPLAYKPSESSKPPLSPTHDHNMPPAASLLTGPDVIEYGSFKPLTFTVACDICRHAIPPSLPRYHCFSCISSFLPDCQPGDYDICSGCYTSLVARKRISADNGPHGWRRCPRGHRLTILGFDDARGGQHRVVLHDLVGGRCLLQEPYRGSDVDGLPLQLWSWAGGAQGRLVTVDVAAVVPSRLLQQLAASLRLAGTFPPEGGVGLRALALWSWYPKVDEEGEAGAAAGGDELLFPKGAEIRECVDVNGDWFFGVYMGVGKLFPAPYVRVIGGGGRG